MVITVSFTKKIFALWPIYFSIYSLCSSEWRHGFSWFKICLLFDFVIAYPPLSHSLPLYRKKKFLISIYKQLSQYYIFICELVFCPSPNMSSTSPEILPNMLTTSEPGNIYMYIQNDLLTKYKPTCIHSFCQQIFFSNCYLAALS